MEPVSNTQYVKSDIARELIELIGWADTTIVLTQLGGGKCYFKCKEFPPFLSFLVDRYGLPRHSAIKLWKHYRGDSIDFPLVEKLFIVERNTAMRQDYNAGGIGIAEIAKKYGVVWRHAYRIVCE
ncbi:MAG: Mor transcription activator family protein [Arenicellales bacterium]